jgi:hypothetical protein
MDPGVRRDDGLHWITTKKAATANRAAFFDMQRDSNVRY